VGDGKTATIRFQSEPGIWLKTTSRSKDVAKDAPLAIVLDLEGEQKAADSKIVKALRDNGWKVRTVDLRATGALAWPADRIGGAPDHNTAQWGLWIGRPLLGQWTLDVRRLLDAVKRVEGKLPDRIAVVGQGPAGIVALTVGAVDDRVTDVVTVDSLASYVSDAPYKNQRLGTIVPGMVREVGDIAHLAALCLPKRVVIAGRVLGDGTKLSPSQLRSIFEPTTQVADLLKLGTAFHTISSDDTDRIIKTLR
jgi:hypothetical protein